ncbi:DUF6300 family protein [Streptomyces sp. NPDC050485]|uniref:DUF6300 family protein n=1 Tax=Streptomyces sp. NPDC050485 TaxID=3365617 RepID=UPI0037905349
MTEPDEETELRLADLPPCPRCGGTTLLAVRYPHSWRNARGKDVTGLREAVLCPDCDHGQETADALLALFTVDGQLDFANMEVFGELAGAWVKSVRARTVDPAMLDDEYERWQRGEL